MNINLRNFPLQVALLSAVAWFPSGADAGLGEEAISGRVQGSGDNLRVCFDRGAPLSDAGQFDIIRHTVRTLPKGLTTLDSEKVGVIRISVVGADQCASAAVVSGSVRAWDWVATRPRS